MNLVLDDSLLPPAGETLVLGVSGGADSLALWDLCAAAGRWPLAIAHLDHGLRDDSPEDLVLVEERLAHYRDEFPAIVMTLHAERDDIRARATEWHCGLEEAGRRRRDELYLAVARETESTRVAVAHHADDQAETLLFNHLRGADLTGRAGMPARRPLADGIELVRPLLSSRREDLRAHLRQRGLAWREDASNVDTNFTRNRLRHRALPVLEAGCPGYTAALLARGERRRPELDELLRELDADLERRWHGDALALVDWPSRDRGTLLLRQCCRRLGLAAERHRIERLTRLVGGPVGRRLELGHLLFLRRRDRLAWEAARPLPATGRVPLAVPGETRRGDGRITTTEEEPPTDPRDAAGEAHLDIASVTGDLWWGPVEAGCTWRPLGLGGSKSLRSYLAERGVPARSRACFAVVGDAAGVLWVPGHGLAERAKVTDSTQRVLHLRYAGRLGSG